MNSIDLILGVVSVAGLTDRVAHLTVSPCTWIRLNAFVTERWVFWSGFDEAPLTTTRGLRISIDYDQQMDFRIWDREGREVLFDWGNVFEGMRNDC